MLGTTTCRIATRGDSGLGVAQSVKLKTKMPHALPSHGLSTRHLVVRP